MIARLAAYHRSRGCAGAPGGSGAEVAAAAVGIIAFYAPNVSPRSSGPELSSITGRQSLAIHCSSPLVNQDSGTQEVHRG